MNILDYFDFCIDSALQNYDISDISMEDKLSMLDQIEAERLGLV